MYVARMHASDRNVGRNACKWQEFKKRNASGRNTRSRVIKVGMNASTWQDCMQVSGMHPTKLREHRANIDMIEEVNSESKSKSTLVHFWGLEQIVKRSKIICSVVHNALFYACCGNAFWCYTCSEECYK
jgi:hypothetical protein